MARSPRPQDISWFLDLYEKNQLNLDPPYQRRSVWSPRDKRFFVDTILNNYPVPPVFLHKTLDDKGRATYHVVDGKQRIKTIIEFVNNKVPIPDDFPNITLRKKKWRDLDKTQRDQFWNYEIVVEMLPEVNESYVSNIFERINRNARGLKPQELRHAKYDGWFINVAENEAEKQEWKDFGVVTTGRAKRMADVQFISELMSLTIKKAIEGFDQDELDAIYADYEDLSDIPEFIEDDFQASFENSKAIIRKLLSLKPFLASKVKIQSHFYSLWAFVTIESDRASDESIFYDRYAKFISDVTNTGVNQPLEDQEPIEHQEYKSIVDKYTMNARGASTELPQRLARHEALVSLFSLDPSLLP